MTETASLVIKVDSSGAARATSDLSRLDKAASGSERAANKFGKAWGLAIGTVASAALLGATRAIVRATIEEERAIAQLEARLKSTGGAAGLAKDELLKMASGLQSVTTFADDAIIGAQSLLLTFTKIGRDVFPKATETVLDMSVALGQDLKSSAVQLGKALNDPILGVTALGRVGVQFTKSQKELIKSLVETGKGADAQRIILKELETQMGGSARAARDTLGGAIDGLKNAFGDLLEGDTSGEGVKGTTKAINDLTKLMGSSETKQAFGSITSGVFDVTAAIVDSIPKIIEWAKQLQIGLGLAQDAQGQQGGTILDMFGGLKRGATASYDYAAGALTGDAARRQQALNTARTGSEQLRAGITGGKFTDQYTNPGQLPGYLGGQDYITGNQPFSAVKFSAIGQKPRMGSQPEAEPDEAKKKGLSEAEQAARRLQSAYESLTESQKEQIALFGETTEAARVRYAVEQGALQGLTDAQKASLIADAERIDQMEDLAAIEAEWAEQATENIVKEGERTKAVMDGIAATDELIESMEFELSLIGMNNEARAKAIALRWADKDATEAQIAAIGDLAVATERASEQQHFADQTQRSLTGAVVDYASKTKTATEAFGDFADQLFERALQFVADKAIQAMFDSFNGGGKSGSSSGGSGGGWMDTAMGLFSSFFGGGREFGGPVTAGGMYEVGEKNKPELFRSGGKQYMIPGNNGAVVPMQGQGAPTNITINVPNMVQYRTAAQIAQETAAAQGRAQARNR